MTDNVTGNMIDHIVYRCGGFVNMLFDPSKAIRKALPVTRVLKNDFFMFII